MLNYSNELGLLRMQAGHGQKEDTIAKTKLVIHIIGGLAI